MGIIINTLFFLALIAYIFAKKKKNENLSIGFMFGIIIYHFIFNIIYFLVFGYETDAYVQYYVDGLEEADMSSIQTSTSFMYQVCYFFHNYLKYSYNDIQIFFSIFTSFGFIKYYEILKEFDNKNSATFLGINLLYISLFIPSFHFWLSTVQKDCFFFIGSISLLSVLINIKKKKLGLKLIVLALLTFSFIAIPRPYALAFISIPLILVFVIFSKTKWLYKIILFTIIAVALQFTLPKMLGINSLSDLNPETIEEIITTTNNLSIYASHGNAGLEVTGNESLGFRIIAYLYFPLFFNSPNPLGYILSVENLLFLLLTFSLLKNVIRKFKLMIRTKIIFFSLCCFITIAVLMSFISFNIGANTRTKIMAYPYFFLALYGLSQLSKPQNKKLKVKVL